MLQAIGVVKVSIQPQSTHSNVGDRPKWSLPGGAGRGVGSDQLLLEQDIWSKHCQNPSQSSRQPKTTRATARQSRAGLNTSDAMRDILVWGKGVRLRKKKKEGEESF